MRLVGLPLLSVLIGLTLAVPAGASGANSVRMPNLVGLSRAWVYRIMNGDHLYFATQGPGAADETWVSVRDQSIRPGTLVPALSQVVLDTSMSPAHDPFPAPNLVGRNHAEVLNILMKDGLYFKTVGLGANTARWVDVLSQTPAPGTLVRFHDSLTLRVTTHAPVVSAPTTTTTTAPASTTTTTAGETTTTVAGATTTSAPTTTTTAPAVVTPVPHDYRVGVATWYSYIPGRCATSYLPFGIHLHVRDLATGRVIVCITSDREEARGNRVVDLSETQFSQLAPLGQGVISVRVSW